MSSAGHIYRESIIALNESSPGVKTYSIDVENDGIIISIEKISGDGEAIATLYSDLPDPMTKVFLGRAKASIIGIPQQGAFITGRKVELRLDWTSALECRLSIKRASGAAVTQFIAQQTPASNDEEKYRKEVVQLLSNIQDNQVILINHLRQITEINDECGDIF